MFELLVSDFLRFSHLLAVAVGFGVAVETEAFMFRRRRSSISKGMLSGLEHRHNVIMLALGAMWVTGLALVALRTGFQLSAFTPKLWAKVSVVTILSINAFFVARVAMPILADHAGRRVADLKRPARQALFAVAGISATSWIMGLLLGSSVLLRVGPAWLFQSLLPMAYIVGIGLAIFVGDRLYGQTVQRTANQSKPKPIQKAAARPSLSQDIAAKLTSPLLPKPAVEPAPRTVQATAPKAPQKTKAKARRVAAASLVTEPKASDLAIAFAKNKSAKPRLRVEPKTATEPSTRAALASLAGDLGRRA